MSILTKRVYEKPERKDGTRILVDRLWPRGLSKADAQVDVWVKDIAPSNDLRRWYNHESQKWAEFRKRYFDELDAKEESVKELLGHMGPGTVTFLYGAKELRFNNAVALKEYVESVRSR